MGQRYNDSPKRTKPQDAQLRILKNYTFSVLNKSPVIDHRKSFCACQKALSIGYHDCHYLDIATTFFFFFNSFENSSKINFLII